MLGTKKSWVMYLEELKPLTQTYGISTSSHDACIIGDSHL